MGWFDNEQDGQNPNSAPPQTESRRPATRTAPAAALEPGSTLGRQIHVDGTIICDEDLTILGRVDGTIRAQGTLVIAKEADVRAKIDGSGSSYTVRSTETYVAPNALCSGRRRG